MTQRIVPLLSLLLLVLSTTCAFTVVTSPRSRTTTRIVTARRSTEVMSEDVPTVEAPEDAVITIKPNAMNRLRELRAKKADDGYLILRMGVRNGGCSGLSYVMDFSTEDDIGEDDQIDEYPTERIKCVVDAKSMLYLFGLQLDYSEELIGGGFKVSESSRLV